MGKINIKALEGSKMIPGKVYTVSEDSASVLIKYKRAVKAKDSEKVGGIYYPKSSKDLTK